jgi:UDP-4-amino-4,6-dideoxy-L-N-acetyl-beta-L-altrosamine transaminase
MSSSFLPYAKQSIQEEDLQAVVVALKEDLITRGPPVQSFEQAVADYCHVPYAVAFNSGTSALMACYFAAGLTPYDCVISTPNTFIATVGAAIQMGSRLRFVDLDRSTGNFNLSQLEHCLDFRSTRGRLFIVPMHFAGIAMDMAELDRQICHPDTVVIEDAAQALGSSYPTGQKVGSCLYSQMTVFSFHPAKIMTTGEGGMVTTRDPELFHRLKLFRDNGIERSAPFISHTAPGYYEAHAVTGNFNFTSFQAALGLSQMKRLEQVISKRRNLVKRYRHHLSQVPHLTLLTDKHDNDTAFHLFVVQINFDAYRTTREEVMHALKEKGIGSQVHYVPLYCHPVVKCDVEIEKLKCPENEIYYQQALSLPLYSDLLESDVDRICGDLISILNRSPNKFKNGRAQ